MFVAKVVKKSGPRMPGGKEVPEPKLEKGKEYVAVVAKGLPADGVLRRGDVITAVDGKPVTCKANAASLIRARSPGDPVTLTIARTVGGHRVIRQFHLKSAAIHGAPVVGVKVVESYVFPFNVRIRVGDIGGPSAGLMFALGIVDKLTEKNLTGGKFIAGTGEITPSGLVQPIGGIQQKMVAARSAGATVFLAPAGNCADTVGAVPAGLRVVKVSTLPQAVSDLEDIQVGKPVPSC